jgi:pimeloyl-ACP methyl ester carboxylesterase
MMSVQAAAKLDPFRSVTLMVTTSIGALRLFGIPPVSGIAINAKAWLDPRLDTKQRGDLQMEMNFRRRWLEADSDKLHPRTGARMTNRQAVTRLAARIYFGKRKDGVRPNPTFMGMLRQLSAVVTHHLSSERLERIRSHMASSLSKPPILVIAATEDHLVRHSTGSSWLLKALAPSEYLVVESGHGVNIEGANEVNEAMARLFALAEERVAAAHAQSAVAVSDGSGRGRSRM